MIRKLILVSALAATVLALVACGGGGSAGGGGSSSVTLGQTYSAADSPLSFKYPDGWVVNGAAGQVLFASSEDAMSSTSPVAGAFAGSLLSVPPEQAATMGANVGVVDVLNTFKQLMSGEGAPAFGDVRQEKVGSYDTASIIGSSADGDAVIYVVKVGDAFVVAIGASAKGELGNFEGTLKAMIESITYTAPAAG